MIWDATMWTYWQPALRVLADKKITIWDESSWTNLKQKDDSEAGRIVRTAQKTTRNFFPAVAQWLGNKPCPCAGVPEEPVEGGLQVVHQRRDSFFLRRAPKAAGAVPAFVEAGNHRFQ